jgi:predicted enzyme related to lactoylglutathione lyase
MNETTINATGPDDTSDLPWPPTLAPYLAVADARRAIDWYGAVFAGAQRGAPHVMPDGSIGHAEVAIGDAVVMLSEGSAGVPVQPPPSQPSTYSHTLHLQVDDVDATARRAAARGARVEREPTDYPYGRIAVIVDPFGHRWMLNKVPERATRHAHGEISYVTMVVADDERAKQFYGAVLGWEFEPGSVPRAWGPVGQREFGIWAPGDQRPEVQLCYRVRDVESAARRVRDNGGQAGEVVRKPYGLMLDCVDNQGAHFQLWQPAD